MSVFNWFSFTTRLVIEFTSNVSTSASAHTASLLHTLQLHTSENSLCSISLRPFKFVCCSACLLVFPIQKVKIVALYMLNLNISLTTIDRFTGFPKARTVLRCGGCIQNGIT
jgi:hypothetical protein